MKKIILGKKINIELPTDTYVCTLHWHSDNHTTEMYVKNPDTILAWVELMHGYRKKLSSDWRYWCRVTSEKIDKVINDLGLSKLLTYKTMDYYRVLPSDDGMQYDILVDISIVYYDSDGVPYEITIE